MKQDPAEATAFGCALATIIIVLSVAIGFFCLAVKAIEWAFL